MTNELNKPPLLGQDVIAQLPLFELTKYEVIPDLRALLKFAVSNDNERMSILARKAARVGPPDLTEEETINRNVSSGLYELIRDGNKLRIYNFEQGLYFLRNSWLGLTQEQLKLSSVNRISASHNEILLADGNKIKLYLASPSPTSWTLCRTDETFERLQVPGNNISCPFSPDFVLQRGTVVAFMQLADNNYRMKKVMTAVYKNGTLGNWQGANNNFINEYGYLTDAGLWRLVEDTEERLNKLAFIPAYRLDKSLPKPGEKLGPMDL